MPNLADGPHFCARTGKWRYARDGKMHYEIFPTRQKAAEAYLEEIKRGKFGSLLQGKPYEECCRIVGIAP